MSEPESITHIKCETDHNMTYKKCDNGKHEKEYVTHSKFYPWKM